HLRRDARGDGRRIHTQRRSALPRDRHRRDQAGTLRAAGERLMTLRFDPEALQHRAEQLGTLNGFKLVFVSLEPVPQPSFALLDVEFQNANHLAPLPVTTDFAISGGVRIRAGSNPGDIQVTQVQASALPHTVRLKVAPVGDYSTYTLSITPPRRGSD